MAAVFEKYSEDKSQPNIVVANLRPKTLKARFLELYPLIGVVGKTCDILNMCRRTFYHWKDDDKEFEKAFTKAEEMCLHILEDEAMRRAVYGVQRPVYQGGKFVGYVTEYSDTLLVLMLKAKAPHKYKERFAGELTGADGKPLNTEHKVIHIHSNVPMAELEEHIDMTTIPYVEVVPNIKTQDNEQLDELLG